MAITTFTSGDNGSTVLSTLNANFTDLDTTKADLASPTFTGTPTLPTGTVATTQSAGDSSTKVATTAFVASAVIPTIETTTGTTHSLTTTAGQKVIVWAKGTCSNTSDGSSSDITLTVKYNTVTKDTVLFNPGNETDKVPFALMYTETPGAATQNITVEVAGSTVSISNVVIIVMKIG